MNSRPTLNDTEANALRKKLDAYRVQRDKVWEGQSFGKHVSTTASLAVIILLLFVLFKQSFRELIVRSWFTNPEFVIVGLGLFVVGIFGTAVRHSLTFGYAVPRSDNNYQLKKFKRETGFTPEEASNLLNPTDGPSAVELQVEANIRGL